MQKRQLPSPTETKAASAIQRFYRTYRKAKTEEIKKDDLLKYTQQKADEKKHTADPVNEKYALFMHNNGLPVLFPKTGMRTLFPQGTINLKLLEHYLNQKKDIRLWVLEAYLHGLIDKHNLMTLFSLQQDVNEFLKETKETSPLKVYAVHDKTGLTSEAKFHLMRQMISDAPQYVHADQKRNAAYEQKISDSLSKLPPHANYFAVMTLPRSEVYKMAFILMAYHNGYGKAPLLQALNNFLEAHRSFFCAVAQTLGLKCHKFTHPSQYYAALWDQLMQKVLPRAFATREGLAHFIDNNELFSLAAANIINIPHQLMPVYYEGESPGGGCFGMTLYGSAIQDAMLFAATDKNPEELIRKAPMFGELPVQPFHDFTLQNARIIGLELPNGVPIAKTVHTCRAGAGSYTRHDQAYHYPVALCMKALAEPLMDMRIALVKLIQQETGHNNNYIIAEVLDFANAFFYRTYTGAPFTSEQMQNILAVPNEESKFHAQFEYALLVAIDIVKNFATYESLFKKIPGHQDVPREKIQELLINGVLLTSDWNPHFVKYAAQLKKWSYSVGTFMLLMKKHISDTQFSFVALGDQLTALLEKGMIQLKWNVNFGLMLNIDNYSFRFRMHDDSERQDYRLEKKFEQDGVKRMNSTAPEWWIELQKQLSQKSWQAQNPVKSITGNSP